MPILVTMPSLSPTMEKGNLVKWCKKVGDSIDVGEVIAEIDTDKATMEVESLHKGVLAKIIVEEGTHDVLVKSPIAIIRQKGDTDQDIENFKIPNLDAQQDSKKTENEPIVHKHEEIGEQNEHENKIKASPLAKRLANEYGIDLSSLISGTGPGGRIVKEDILNYKSSAKSSSSGSYTDKKVLPLTLTVANKMTKCKQNIPHFYVTIKADVTDMMEILRKLKEKRTEIKITAESFIIKAVALAMKKCPEVNVSWQGQDTIRYYHDVDVSVAVAVDGGIYTPVIRKADTKSIMQIAVEVKDLANKAKAGMLKPEEYTGGSITTSNLGMFDIESFYSIINVPQASIISIARAVQAPLVRNSQIEIGYTLSLGYAVDHRAIDGKTAGYFLTILKNLLEDPIGLMI